MPQTKAFGRRAQPSPAGEPIARDVCAEPAAAPVIAPPTPEHEIVPRVPTSVVGTLTPKPISIEQELEEWKQARRIRKRSFREPWRTVSIVAGIAFAATSWLVPDEVATIARIALGILTLGSLYAGWRRRKAG